MSTGFPIRARLATPLLCLVVGLLWPERGLAAPVPRLAVSLPAGVAHADAARVLEACGARDALVILPPTTARLGDDAEPVGSDPAPGGLPGRAFLHLRLEIGLMAATGREREALIERQVADLVRGLAVERPEIAGLVIESAAAADFSDLRQFVLASLIVKAKGVKPGLDIALEAPQAAIPPRLLAYIDTLVVGDAALARLGDRTSTRPPGGGP